VRCLDGADITIVPLKHVHGSRLGDQYRRAERFGEWITEAARAALLLRDGLATIADLALEAA